MKKSIFILFVMILANTGLQAQMEAKMSNTSYLSSPAKIPANHISYTGPGGEKDYEYYMKKSRNQRMVGWTTLIGGVVLSGIGVLIASSSSYSDGEANAAGVLLLAGAVSGIVSIPFMIMASVNKHKAKLLLDNQKTGYGVPFNVDKHIPGVTLRITIGK